MAWVVEEILKSQSAQSIVYYVKCLFRFQPLSRESKHREGRGVEEGQGREAVKKRTTLAYGHSQGAVKSPMRTPEKPEIDHAH